MKKLKSLALMLALWTLTCGVVQAQATPKKTTRKPTSIASKHDYVTENSPHFSELHRKILQALEARSNHPSLPLNQRFKSQFQHFKDLLGWHQEQWKNQTAQAPNQDRCEKVRIVLSKSQRARSQNFPFNQEIEITHQCVSDVNNTPEIFGDELTSKVVLTLSVQQKLDCQSFFTCDDADILVDIVSVQSLLYVDAPVPTGGLTSSGGN